MPVVKPKAIEKRQLTTAPSIVHWRDVYGVLVPVFRARLAAAAPSDDDIIRLLAECAGDVNLALGQLQEAQEWRRSYFPIPRSEVLRTIQTHKIIFHGFDRAGRPVCYYRTRLHDPRVFTPEETVRAVVYLYEELQALARRPGFAGVKDEVCVVVDRTDGKPSNFDVEVRSCCVVWMWLLCGWRGLT